ncbi:DDE superfamily endonuclease [Hirsutella rhossiliensis]|uniref:DDE superfamily endonuclease domain-containing protein n=1 Tax=Hirsutella rhossiliensis TaxID=111463 RepID=A0A9P8MNC9_9HYPO|nr:DDE superfamily endonuclease domain-containing protein [Hirsutella rhossiliensis]KAH0958457.1 DDE superfamily endonuclease domain-containing protein [Hirsutella rhossiliensis]
MASSKAKESAVQKWIDSATGLPNFSRHTTANLETRTIAGAELYYEGFYGSIVARRRRLAYPTSASIIESMGITQRPRMGATVPCLIPRMKRRYFAGHIAASHRGTTSRVVRSNNTPTPFSRQRAWELQHREPGPSALYSGIENSSTVEEQQRETSNGRLCKIASTLRLFRGWSQTIEKDEILPKNTWNFDETGFMVGYLHKGTFIWTFREIDTPILSDAHDTVSVTAIEAISAAGSCIPSFVILPGVQIPARWVSNSLDDDTIISTSQKGYINDLIHFRSGFYLDSCDNHYTEEMVHFCFDHNIKVFPMPPHLTHQLQPLDVGVFRSYKHWHQQVLHREIADGAYDFNKSDFLYHLQEVRTRTFKKHTILSSWQKCGLFPFNPEIVLSQLQDTLSSLTEEVAIKDLPGSIESEPQGGPQAARPSTPSPPPPSIQRFNWNNVSTPRLNLFTIQRYHAYKARKADKTLALNGITATAEMTKIKEKQAKRSSLQQQTTIVARYGPLSVGDARIRVARDEYNRQAAQEEEAQRVRNKEVRDEAGYIRRWLRKVRFNVRISITEAREDSRYQSYRILRELHNRGVGQSKAIMWPEYYDREIVKEAAELVVMEANKRAICRQTLSLEADGIEMR